MYIFYVKLVYFLCETCQKQTILRQNPNDQFLSYRENDLLSLVEITNMLLAVPGMTTNLTLIRIHFTDSFSKVISLFISTSTQFCHHENIRHYFIKNNFTFAKFIWNYIIIFLRIDVSSDHEELNVTIFVKFPWCLNDWLNFKWMILMFIKETVTR